MDTNRVLNLYKHVKPEFGYEKYLDIVQNKKLRSTFTRLRLSAHNLRIETGRYGRNRIERQERYCVYCDLRDIEDEFHFTLVCPLYIDIRSKYIATYYVRHPSMIKFMALLQSDSTRVIRNICKYLLEASNRRKELN